MKNQSITLTGIIISLLAYASTHFNWGIDENDITTFVLNVAQIVGMFIVYYDRWSKGDVNFLGRRTKKQL